MDDINTIISELERQRAAIDQALEALRGVSSGLAKRRGRPKKVESTTPAPVKKRKLSPEGRKRIIAALKKRWAAKNAAR